MSKENLIQEIEILKKEYADQKQYVEYLITIINKQIKSDDYNNFDTNRSILNSNLFKLESLNWKINDRQKMLKDE